jgi:diamine N-acetyltransferase
LPDIQKTGAGKALMDHAFEIAKANNARQLILNVNRNNPAKGFYERLGFSIIKEEDVDLGNGVVQEDYVMAISL